MACSTCKLHEPPAGRRLCLDCQAAYMRRYRATVEPMAVRQARKEGQESMRLALIEEFRELGDRHFNGWTAAQIVRDLTIG